MRRLGVRKHLVLRSACSGSQFPHQSNGGGKEVLVSSQTAEKGKSQVPCGSRLAVSLPIGTGIALSPYTEVLDSTSHCCMTCVRWGNNLPCTWPEVDTEKMVTVTLLFPDGLNSLSLKKKEKSLEC